MKVSSKIKTLREDLTKTLSDGSQSLFKKVSQKGKSLRQRFRKIR